VLQFFKALQKSLKNKKHTHYQRIAKARFNLCCFVGIDSAIRIALLLPVSFILSPENSEQPLYQAECKDPCGISFGILKLCFHL